MNDRSLRNIIVGLGGKGDGVVRQAGFDITVASEIMAILCLATSMSDLKERLSRMVVAYNTDGNPVTAGDLEATGAMALLLKDAIKPNLVQTLENTPAFIHGGRFGADLGAEKFFDIKCRFAGLNPDAVVIVATVRALKMNGGVPKTELSTENLNALEKGIANLERHLENLEKFGVSAVVAINKFPADTEAELELLREKCAARGVEVILSDVFAKGGEGGIALASKVVKICETKKSNYAPLYDVDGSIAEKITTIAQEIYRADGVDFTADAKKQIAELEKLSLDKMPICMAKTQYSFSDNANLLGAPIGFRITVREVKVSAGAGFIVAITGDIMTMPGLPKVPAANGMDITEDGVIIGLS